MTNYYSKKLNANNLQRCYEVSPPRVRQFLEAEICHVLDTMQDDDKILDLGCGYGRVAARLAEKSGQVVGIDISPENIQLANELHKGKGIQFFEMNAIDLAFDEGLFDMTICIQNGISAFKVDPRKLLKEALRVTRKGGRLLFSSYAEDFWDERLKWFEIQAAQGLIGEIDHNLTGDGTIICKDGFKANTWSGQEFRKLASDFKIEAEICKVDNSSVFCEIIKQ